MKGRNVWIALEWRHDFWVRGEKKRKDEIRKEKKEKEDVCVCLYQVREEVLAELKYGILSYERKGGRRA